MSKLSSTQLFTIENIFAVQSLTISSVFYDAIYLEFGRSRQIQLRVVAVSKRTLLTEPAMKKPLSTLEQYFEFDAVVIHSLDMCLYQASVRVDGQDIWVATEQGQLLKTNSLIAMQKHLANLNTKQYLLRQQSAYDEMVGGPLKVDNTLEVPIGDSKLY